MSYLPVIIITKTKDMTRPANTLSDLLRNAIIESGMAHIAIERATGVKRGSIMRFLRGETSLRLDKADALAALFGLELRRKKRG
jgi:plasmid maintenance system antidote protein VapI